MIGMMVNAQLEFARPNLDLPINEARSEAKLRHLGVFFTEYKSKSQLQNTNPFRFG